MAAKLLHSLTDENPDLQKQIGCMTGIFQLFDRQPILTTSGRHIVGRSPKRQSRGTRDQASGSSLESDSDEKYSDSNILERQRTFSELSRPSFSSSSRSSSFSSIDYNRATQYEPASFDRITFPDSPSMEAEMSLKNSSPQFSRRNLDLRDFVKDSMYREVQGLSSKAKTIEAAGDPSVKYRDSPRLQSQIRDGHHASYLDARQRIHVDLKESVRVLAELQDTPWYHNEPRGLMRSSSYHAKETSRSISRDAPRFSCDGREVNRGPCDSLDIRGGPKRSMTNDYESNLFSKSLEKVRDEFRGKAQSAHCTPGRQARPPSVVAKLMGLEMLPNCVSSGDTNTASGGSYPEKDFAKLSRSSAKANPSLNQLSSSSKNFRKDPCSPRWRKPDSSVKPMPRVPIEPAPWKRIDSSRSKQKPGSRTTKAQAKVPSSFPSVYSEIEERLKDLEFTRSGRDLRALKQILEAMQSKGFLGTEKGGSGPQNLLTSKQEAISGSNSMPQIDQVLECIKRTGVAHNYESPIVIMKPANLLGSSGIPAASVISLDVLSGMPKLQDDEVQENWNGFASGRMLKDLSLKSSQQHNTVNSAYVKADRTLKSTQASTRSQHLVKDGNAGSRKSSESVSPRLQQKKLELERSSRPPTPPDSAKFRRQSNKQQGDCNSPGSRRRLKYPNFPQSNDQLNEFNVISKNLKHCEADSSVQSNESTVWSSKNVVAFGFERSPGISSVQNQPIKSSESVISGSEGKEPTQLPGEEEPAELGVVPLEYSSPVSVLDNVVCKENSPSPIKNVVGTTLEVDTESSFDVVRVCSLDRYASTSVGSDSISEIERIKLPNIDNLGRKLRKLNSNHDEVHTDYIASLCEHTDPDHRYISEIFLASGLLLRDLGSNMTSFQFHSYNHPINPELFVVLEQIKARSSLLSTQGCIKMRSQLTMKEKLHRKLVFETVNEILARKLASAGSFSSTLLRSGKLSRRVLNAHKLLGELCSEIEEIRPKNHKCSPDEEDGRWKNILFKDVMQQSERWAELEDGMSGAVLDVERLIFKDLVSEVVMGECGGVKARPASRRRGLHTK